MRKPYPIDGFEEDLVYSRRIYSYLNNPKNTKFLKRKMNKRFRNPQNISEIEEGVNEYEDYRNPEV